MNETQDILPGDLFTKNAYDFRIQFIVGDCLCGLKYRSEDRGKYKNFADAPDDTYRKNVRISMKEFLEIGATKVE